MPNTEKAWGYPTIPGLWQVVQATSLVGTVLGLDHGAVFYAAVVAEDAAVVVGEDGDDAQHPHAHDGEAGRAPAEEHLPDAE